MSDLASSASLPASYTGAISDLEKAATSAKAGIKDTEKLAEKATTDENKAIQESSDLTKSQMKDRRQYAIDNPFPHPDIKPWSAKPPENNPIQRFGSWASALGILAGAITKTGLASSMNASAAAMNAYRKNDLDAYDEAHKAWKENTNIAIEQADWEAKAYQAGWDLMDKDQAGATQLLHNAATMAHNTGMLAQLKAGNYKDAFEISRAVSQFAVDGPKRMQELDQIALTNRRQMQLNQEWLAKNPGKQLPPDVALSNRTQAMQESQIYKTSPPGATYFEKKVAAVDDVEPIVEAMHALIDFDPNTIGVIGRRNTILGNVLGQLGNDVSDAQARSEQVKQLANMAVGPLNEIYGVQGRFNKSMLDIINNIDPVTKVLVSPQNALQSLDTIKSDLSEKRTRYDAATKRTPPAGSAGAQPAASGKKTDETSGSSEPIPEFSSIEEAQAAAEIDGWDVGTMFQIKGENTPRRVTKKVGK
jgi:hypothetical protein